MPNLVDAQYVETQVALSGNAVFNGPARATSGADKFRVYALADQIGTINIQQSNDGVVWVTTDTVATVANVAKELVADVNRRWIRASYTNGATPNTTFQLESKLIGQ